MRIRLTICFTVAVISALVVTEGCSHRERYTSSINSIASNDVVTGKKYLFLPGNQNVSVEDLEFLEYAAYVDRLRDLQREGQAMVAEAASLRDSLPL